MSQNETLLVNPCGTASPPHYELAVRKKGFGDVYAYMLYMLTNL